MAEEINYVLAAHRSHFDAFKNALKARGKKEFAIAQRLVYCRSAADFKLNHRYNVFVVGPFWQMAEFSEIMASIVERCQGRFLSIQWFPHPVRCERAIIHPATGQVVG